MELVVRTLLSWNLAFRSLQMVYTVAAKQSLEIRVPKDLSFH